MTLYLFGTYSKMYLYEFSSDCSTSPPSPEHIAVLTAELPIARAILISRESAPKDMWVMYIGVSIISGCFALGPIVVRVLTGSSSFNGSVDN